MLKGPRNDATVKELNKEKKKKEMMMMMMMMTTTMVAMMVMMKKMKKMKTHKTDDQPSILFVDQLPENNSPRL